MCPALAGNPPLHLPGARPSRDLLPQLNQSTVINASSNPKLRHLAHRLQSAYFAHSTLSQENGTHTTFGRTWGPALRGPSPYSGGNVLAIVWWR